MYEFNEIYFAQTNTNFVNEELTLELTLESSFGLGFNLISMTDFGFIDFEDVINVLKGRSISVGEEWNFTELTESNWTRIFQYYIKGGVISEIDVEVFKQKYKQIIDFVKSDEFPFNRIPTRRALGKRQYKLSDIKDQFNSEYELDLMKIDMFNPFVLDSVVTCYHYNHGMADDYYFYDNYKYFGLFVYISS